LNKLIVLFVAILFFTITQSVAARSGCCSSHKGVCGCGCCDGTPLSSTCAPYYPECNNSKPVYVPPSPTPKYYPVTTSPLIKSLAPTPSLILLPSPTLTPTLIPTPNPTTTSEPTIIPSPTTVAIETTTSKGNPTGGIITLLIFSGIGIGIAKFIIGKGKSIPRNLSTL
jgi:hypothetical protein